MQHDEQQNHRPVPADEPAEKTELKDLLDISEIKPLIADFFVLTGIGIAIADLKGTILAAAGGQDICRKFHRIHPQTRKNCLDSAAYLNGNMKPGEHLVFKCRNHMLDVVTPIVVGDLHFGNIFLGQFFYEDESPDRDVFLRQAEDYGFDRDAYMDALDRVPRWSRSRIETAINFSARYATILSRMAYMNLELKKALKKQRLAEFLVTSQRDLGFALERSTTLAESLRLCLDAALQVSGLDAGGIYILDQDTDALKLIQTLGVSDRFRIKASHSPADDERTLLVMAGESIYLDAKAIGAMQNEDLLTEGLKSVAVIPLSNMGKIIGCLNIASHSYDFVPEQSRDALETIARQIGVSVARFQMHESLRLNEEKYRELVENANSIILRMDRIGHVTFFNRFAQKFFGYQEREIVGQNVIGTIVPARDMSGRDLQGMILDIGMNPDRYINNENENMTKNGDRVWIAWTNRPVYDDKGDLAEILCIGNDISDRKSAEAAVQESRQKLYDIINFLPDATFVIDQGGKVISWNRAMEAMTGIKSEDMVDKGNYEYALPFYGERRPLLIDLVLEPRKVLESRYASMARDDTSLTGEAHMPALRGGEAYLFGKASILRDSRGHIIGAIETIQDITDRRQAEEKYRSIFDNCVDGIVQSTPEGRYLSVNPPAARMFGYESPQEMIEAVRDVAKQHYVDPLQRVKLLKELEDKGRVDNFEVHVCRKDGKKFWVSYSARTVRNRDGSVLYFEGTQQDITKRKKVEDALRDSEERLRSIIEASNAGILMLSMEGKILFSNPQIAEMLGYESRSLVGTRYLDHIHPSEKDQVSVILRSVNKTEIDQSASERRFLRKDGSDLWGYVGGRRLRRSRGEDRLVLVVSDMTGLKKAESEKKFLEDQLRQAQKMEAIGTLAGGIAHDFNNILASVMGYTELSIKEAHDEKRRGYLDQVMRASERAKNLVSQILAFSRQQEQERRPLDIRIMIKEALKLMHSTIPTTIRIRDSIAPGVAVVMADPTQIHQIVMNLCTNAAHAMRDQGGVLGISLSKIEVTPEWIKMHSELKAGPYVLLEVSDTGHGIDPAIREKIFDPFFTTKKPREGTGLGLSVVYGIVRTYGGGISVESSPGVGSTFSIYLPLVKSKGTAAEQKRTAALKGGQEKILFVDDEESLVELVPDFLRSMGYEVVSTTSSMDALRLFTEAPHKFDLVVTDMTMPHMTGLDLSRKILDMRKDLPIILCTGYHETITSEEVKRQGIKKLVMKPISLADMGLLIRKTLDE